MPPTTIGRVTAPADFPEHLPRLPRILAGRHVLGGVDTIEEMMRRASALLGAGLGGPDVELAEHRDRIAVDDLAVKLLRERQRQCRLPAGGGTEDHYQQRLQRAALAMVCAHVQRRLQ